MKGLSATQRRITWPLWIANIHSAGWARCCLRHSLEEAAVGYSTDFVGHISIEPPLNEAEQHYLSRFAATRRMHRKSGPYSASDVLDRDPDVIDSNEPPPGQPGLWCQWVPSCYGRCLVWNGVEKFYAPTEWLRYVIDHFLRPGALALTSGATGLEEFTFDHACAGEVAACRQDTGRLWLIVVDDNDVHEEERNSGVATDLVWGPGMDYTCPAPSGPLFDAAYERAGWPADRGTQHQQ